MPNEFRLIWTTPGGGGQTTLYTRGATGQEQASATKIKNWITGVCEGLSDQVSVNLDPEVRQIQDINGQLIGVVSVDPGNQATGNNPTQPVADSSQVLHRWNTGVIHNGKRVVGRSFIPGLPVGSLTGGNISQATANDFATRATAFVQGMTADPLVVWHRPKDGAGGVSFDVVGASVWTEVAVLRSRRNTR